MSAAERPPGDPLAPLVESSPLLVWRADASGRCDYVNPAWLSFTGLTSGEQLARGWMEGVHPDDAARCRRAFADHVPARTAFELEYRRRRHDGRYRVLVDRVAPLSGAPGFVGTATDVDEERQLDRAKAAFFSVTAHELRASLSATKTHLESLHRAAQRGKQPKIDQIAQLVAQVDRVEGIVRELGDAARLEEGVALMLSLGEVDVGAVVRDAVEASAARLPGKGEKDHTLAIEGAGGPMAVMGDRRRLEQAVTSVLDNAVRYSPQGGRVVVTLKTTGAEHRIAVTDPGIGVPPDEVRSLTRRFYRASNAADRFAGVGLGLSVTKEIVERHGGRLEIDSELGRGTTVTVVLPRVKQP